MAKLTLDRVQDADGARGALSVCASDQTAVFRTAITLELGTLATEPIGERDFRIVGSHLVSHTCSHEVRKKGRRRKGEEGKRREREKEGRRRKERREEGRRKYGEEDIHVGTFALMTNDDVI